MTQDIDRDTSSLLPRRLETYPDSTANKEIKIFVQLFIKLLHHIICRRGNLRELEAGQECTQDTLVQRQIIFLPGILKLRPIRVHYEKARRFFLPDKALQFSTAQFYIRLSSAFYIRRVFLFFFFLETKSMRAIRR